MSRFLPHCLAASTIRRRSRSSLASRVHHRALGDQWDQPGHPQLGRLLDEPVEPLPFGDRRRQGQPAGGHSIGDRLAEQREVDPVLAGTLHRARCEPLAIEDLDDLPDPDPADPVRWRASSPSRTSRPSTGGSGQKQRSAIWHPSGRSRKPSAHLTDRRSGTRSEGRPRLLGQLGLRGRQTLGVETPLEADARAVSGRHPLHFDGCTTRRSPAWSTRSRRANGHRPRGGRPGQVGGPGCGRLPSLADRPGDKRKGGSAIYCASVRWPGEGSRNQRSRGVTPPGRRSVTRPNSAVPRNYKSCSRSTGVRA